MFDSPTHAFFNAHCGSSSFVAGPSDRLPALQFAGAAQDHSGAAGRKVCGAQAQCQGTARIHGARLCVAERYVSRVPGAPGVRCDAAGAVAGGQWPAERNIRSPQIFGERPRWPGSVANRQCGCCDGKDRSDIQSAKVRGKSRERKALSDGRIEFRDKESPRVRG
ncbi:hypothetical protein D3C86_1271750 [compost metagenome]